MIHAVTLADFARRFTDSRELNPDYAATLRSRAAAFQRQAGESRIAAVLSETRLNAFLASLADRSPYTVRGYRTDLLTLWYAAADDGLAPYPVARRVRRKPLPELLVECYTVGEAQALLAAAGELAGRYPNGVARADYWRAAIRLAWDAGIRRGDVWAFRRDVVRPDGTLRIVQRKTRRVLVARLRATTVAALNRIGQPQPLAWTMCAERFGKHFRALADAAGVTRGTFKWLRRSSGSYVEAQQPGAGHKHLGHCSAATFARYYDAHLGRCTLPQPPALK